MLFFHWSSIISPAFDQFPRNETSFSILSKIDFWCKNWSVFSSAWACCKLFKAQCPQCCGWIQVRKETGLCEHSARPWAAQVRKVCLPSDWNLFSNPSSCEPRSPTPRGPTHAVLLSLLLQDHSQREKTPDTVFITLTLHQCTTQGRHPPPHPVCVTITTTPAPRFFIIPTKNSVPINHSSHSPSPSPCQILNYFLSPQNFLF